MNLKKLLTLSLSAIFTQLLNGQNVNLEWVRQMDGSGMFSSIPMVDLDENGNVYTCGAFSGTVDFDPGLGVSNLTAQGTYDIFVSKLDISGNFYWVKRIGGLENDNVASFTLDNTGNIYATGEFIGTVDFNPDAGTYNLTSVDYRDAYITKLDADGNFVWAKQIGETNFIQTHSITTDGSGNVYVTGGYAGTVDLNPEAPISNLTSVGLSDIFIFKLNSSGEFQWAKSMGGSINNDYGLSIKTDSDNNIYTTGYFHGTADFDPSSGVYNLSASESAIFVCKLDASGNLIWAKQMGSAASLGTSIYVDSDRYTYTTGGFFDTGDFDPGSGTANLISSGHEDVFVSKLDESGNFIWASQIGGGEYDGGGAIAVDDKGSVYTSGFFASNADFDPGAGTQYLTSAGDNDAFISKLDSAGNSMWAIRFGGANQDLVTNIKLDGDGNIYASGYFKGTVDFDPGVGSYNLTASVSGGAMFLLKLSQTFASGVLQPSSTNGFSVYPNPAHSILNVQVPLSLFPCEVTVFDMAGRTMTNRRFNQGSSQTIEVGHLNAGMYLVQVISENAERFMSRFIKQ